MEILAPHQSVIDNDTAGRDLLISACLAIIGGFDSRLRIGGMVSINENGKENFHGSEQTGVLCKISSGGKMYLQDDFGVVKRCPISSLSPMQEIKFNTLFMPDSEETTQMWVELLSLSVYKVNTRNLSSGIQPYSNTVNFPLLRLQQQLLLIIKATQVLYTNQPELRKVLKQPYVLLLDDILNQEAQDSDNEGEIETESSSVELVVEKLLTRATQPSPIKAIFSRKELEEAAVALCQHLAGAYRKISLVQIESEPGLDGFQQSATRSLVTDQVKSPVSESSVASPVQSSAANKGSKSNEKKKSSPTAVVQQLMDMGFGRKVVENALRVLSTGTVTPSPETLVAWLLEHQDISSPIDDSTQTQSSVDAEFSDSDSLSDEFEDIDASGHDCCIQPEVFKKPSDFLNSDEYALYVQDHISIGMTVKCIQTFDDVYEGDIGKVVKIERDGLHDLNVQVL